MASNPFMKTVTLTSDAVVYSLLTLMQAIDPGQNGRYCKLVIQNDPGNGAANLYIGNDDLSATNKGTQLVATQAISFETVGVNIINASQIYLKSDTNAIKVNVTALQQ